MSEPPEMAERASVVLSALKYVEAACIEGIVRVTLSRPPVNAVSQAMYAEIRDVFAMLDVLFPTAKVVVLRGAGKHFCAGNDLHEFVAMTSTTAPHRMRLVRDAFAAIYDCPVPTIAAVHGSVLGTGVALASCCDVIVAASDARFGTPEVSVGVMGGGRHLARLVPEARMRPHVLHRRATDRRGNLEVRVGHQRAADSTEYRGGQGRAFDHTAQSDGSSIRQGESKPQRVHGTQDCL